MFFNGCFAIPEFFYGVPLEFRKLSLEYWAEVDIFDGFSYFVYAEVGIVPDFDYMITFFARPLRGSVLSGFRCRSRI